MLFFNFLFLIFSIVLKIILVILFIYQLKTKKQIISAYLFTFSLNTIPEDQTDYLFESSSNETSSISSEKSENILLSDQAKQDLNLDILLVNTDKISHENLNDRSELTTEYDIKSNPDIESDIVDSSEKGEIGSVDLTDIINPLIY